MLLLYLLALSSWSYTPIEALTAQQTTLTNICNKVKSKESSAKTQIYEPQNSCFAYIPAGFLQTLTYAKVKTKCESLTSSVSSLGATCMIGQLVDQATITNLTANVLYTSQKTTAGLNKVYLNLQQTITTAEPACDWYWVQLDGSLTVPDYPIPWCCNEPENNGHSGLGANQGIYINYGGGGFGILDDDQSFTPDGSFCQCVGPPVASSTTTTMRTTTQYSCGRTTFTTTKPPTTTSTTKTTTKIPTTTSTTTTAPTTTKTTTKIPTTTSTTTKSTTTTTPTTTKTTTKIPTSTSTTLTTNTRQTTTTSTTTTTPKTTTTTTKPPTTSTTSKTTIITPTTTTTTTTPTTTKPMSTTTTITTKPPTKLQLGQRQLQLLHLQLHQQTQQRQLQLRQ